MPKRTRDYHSWLLNQLADPAEAASYLNAAISDSPEMFLTALRNVAEARQAAKVGERVAVRRESLVKTLSKVGNPHLSELNSVLKVMGLHIAVEPDFEPESRRRPNAAKRSRNGKTRQDEA